MATAKKVQVTVTHKETVTFNAGDLPDGMVRSLVNSLVNDANPLDGHWSIGDIGGDWEVVEHEVVIG